MRKTVLVAAAGAALVARSRRRPPAVLYVPSPDLPAPVPRRSLRDLVADDEGLVVAEQDARDDHILASLDNLVRRAS